MRGMATLRPLPSWSVLLLGSVMTTPCSVRSIQLQLAALNRSLRWSLGAEKALSAARLEGAPAVAGITAKQLRFVAAKLGRLGNSAWRSREIGCKFGRLPVVIFNVPDWLPC